ncbi:MAG: DUF58 domain-containing protein [Acidimicrobiaceae bacterium]|nr:DUF58 domain-containing protein [Acidimicrobiaceae bacterium]
MTAPEPGPVITKVPNWTRSAGLTAGAAVAVVLAASGLIASRVDVALLAMPLIIAVGLSWGRRPSLTETASARLDLAEPRSKEIDYGVSISTPERVETVVLRYSVLAGEYREFVIAAPLRAGLAGRVPLLHSGPQELVRFEYRFVGADGAAVSSPEQPLIARGVISPEQTAIESDPLPRRLQGLTGSHPSARAGDGGDFRDIHPFQAGDRLRRISWKTTARHAQNAGNLYVRRTDALADATVLIVLDSRDDVGEQVAEWGRNDPATKGISSLDIAREAASSIASGYIHAGDRVGFQDLSSRSRIIPHGGGTRHLWRLLRAIEITAPSPMPFSHRRAPIVPPGALVYLLSSLLDDQAVTLALTWRGKGHRVIAVDVLPAARFDRATRHEHVAHRIVMMERDDRIRVLRARGVELLRWSQDDNTLPLQVQLRLLSQPARHGRSTAGRPR